MTHKDVIWGYSVLPFVCHNSKQCRNYQALTLLFTAFYNY